MKYQQKNTGSQYYCKYEKIFRKVIENSANLKEKTLLFFYFFAYFNISNVLIILANIF